MGRDHTSPTVSSEPNATTVRLSFRVPIAEMMSQNTSTGSEHPPLGFFSLASTILSFFPETVSICVRGKRVALFSPLHY